MFEKNGEKLKNKYLKCSTQKNLHCINYNLQDLNKAEENCELFLMEKTLYYTKYISDEMIKRNDNTCARHHTDKERKLNVE